MNIHVKQILLEIECNGSDSIDLLPILNTCVFLCGKHCCMNCNGAPRAGSTIRLIAVICLHVSDVTTYSTLTMSSSPAYTIFHTWKYSPDSTPKIIVWTKWGCQMLISECLNYIYRCGPCCTVRVLIFQLLQFICNSGYTIWIFVIQYKHTKTLSHCNYHKNVLTCGLCWVLASITILKENNEHTNLFDSRFAVLQVWYDHIHSEYHQYMFQKRCWNVETFIIFQGMRLEYMIKMWNVGGKHNIISANIDQYYCVKLCLRHRTGSLSWITCPRL